jgi:hypothetical protein
LVAGDELQLGPANLNPGKKLHSGR